MTDIEKLRAFVRGYWENADNETKKGEPRPWENYKDGMAGFVTVAEMEDVADFWYKRGIKDLAEMVLAKIGEKE